MHSEDIRRVNVQICRRDLHFIAEALDAYSSQIGDSEGYGAIAQDAIDAGDEAQTGLEHRAMNLAIRLRGAAER